MTSRSAGARASRTPLSRDRVLHAAVALADESGLDALSMRKLGEAVGVEAMSLYGHVANKDDLLDGMIDVVFGEVDLPSAEDGWKTAMRRRATSVRRVLSRHRWAIGLMESRATPGPASLRLHDAVLGCLREGGFSIEMAIQAYSVQDAYIYGFALQEKNLPFDTAEQSAAVAEAQVRQFAELAEQRGFAALAEEFPYLAEVVAGHVAKVGYDFTSAFLHGLKLILDALEHRRLTA